MNEPKKRCRWCDRIKPHSDFRPDLWSYDGHAFKCEACWAKTRERWRQAWEKRT
jgi:hypothetical protein